MPIDSTPRPREKEPSKPTSHHVSQPVTSGWLDNATIPVASTPATSAVTSAPVRVISADNAVVSNPTAPSSSVVTVTSVPPTVSSPAQTPEQTVAPSLGMNYSNACASVSLPMHAGHGTQFSTVLPARLQSSNNLHQSLQQRQDGNSSHEQDRKKSELDGQVRGSPQYEVTTGHHEVNTGHHVSQIQTDAVRQHLYPPGQTNDGRSPSSLVRFRTLLNESNKGVESQMAPALPTHRQFVAASEQMVHSDTRAFSQPQLNTNTSLGHRLPKDEITAQDQGQHQNNQASQSHQMESQLTRAPHYQHANAGKLFEGIEQLTKQESVHGQSQTPTYIQQQQHDADLHLGSLNRQVQQQSMQQHASFTNYETRPLDSHQSQYSQSVYPSYHQQQGSYQVHSASNGQLREETGTLRNDLYDSGLNSSRFHSYQVRHGPAVHDGNGPGDGSYSAIRPLPSARTLQHSTGHRAESSGSRAGTPYRMENRVGGMGRARAVSNGFSAGSPVQVPSPSKVHPTGWGGTLLKDSVKSFQSQGVVSTTEKNEFLSVYMDLMNAYEEKCDSIFDAADHSCIGLIINARIPYLVDTITAPVDDESAYDAQQKLIVKRKFVDAMERLQGDQLPTKRRGNLPKESTAYLKKWFEEHYDHPYPSDEEKLAMSKVTKIGMQQISHWFINYRKRVWKPSLPPSHPVHSGENSKRPRKKMRSN